MVWNCTYCTYENGDDRSRVCSMCEKQRSRDNATKFQTIEQRIKASQHGAPGQSIRRKDSAAPLPIRASPATTNDKSALETIAAVLETDMYEIKRRLVSVESGLEQLNAQMMMGFNQILSELQSIKLASWENRAQPEHGAVECNAAVESNAESNAAVESCTIVEEKM